VTAEAETERGKGQMNTAERATLVIVDGRGETWWANVSDCPSWTAARIDLQEVLFRVQGRWALWTQDPIALLCGHIAAAKLVSDRDAANWLLAHGREVPSELRPLVERWRLRPPVTLQSRASARRRRRKHRAARRATDRGQPGTVENAGGCVDADRIARAAPRPDRGPEPNPHKHPDAVGGSGGGAERAGDGPAE